MSTKSDQTHSTKPTEFDYDCNCDSLCISLFLSFGIFFPYLIPGKKWQNIGNWGVVWMAFFLSLITHHSSL